MGYAVRDFPQSDIVAAVYEQIPEGVRRKLFVSVESDPYHIMATAKFKDAHGREFACQLEHMLVSGRNIAIRVPDVFIAHLCAVV